MPDAVWVDTKESWLRRGRSVVRGQSGIRVVTGERRTERVAGSVQGHGVGTLWDVSQTEGRPVLLPSVDAGSGVTPRSLLAALLGVAGELGYGVREQDLAPEVGGSATDTRRRRIVLDADLDLPSTTAALAHELAHLRMHKLSAGEVCQGLNELEAESVAFTVLTRFGCPMDGSSSGRLFGAAARVGRSPSPRLVQTLGGRVASTAGRLIKAAEQHLPRSGSRREVQVWEYRTSLGVNLDDPGPRM
ncbi:ImmA/IrrE family metallo-endopeptidase [Kribbella yunnanensis]